MQRIAYFGEGPRSPVWKKKKCGDQSFSPCKEPDSSPSRSINNKQSSSLSLSVSPLIAPLFATFSFLFFFLFCFVHFAFTRGKYAHTPQKCFLRKNYKTTQIRGCKPRLLLFPMPFGFTPSL